MEVRERAFQDEQLMQLALNSEKLCTRLTDDALTQIDELRAKVSAYLSGNYASNKDSSRINHTEQPTEVTIHDQQHSSNTIQARMSESVEELATIIKDYAKRHRRLNDRIADLETKVFGIAKPSKNQKSTSTA